MFKMSDIHKEYYLKNFSDLMSIKTVNMKTKYANINTLHNVASCIYSRDKKLLNNKLSDKKEQNCSSVKQQLITLEKIEKYLLLS